MGQQLDEIDPHDVVARFEHCPPRSILHWGALLELLLPHLYAEPVWLPQPATTYTRAERVQLLIDRESAGLQLWNPEGDVIILDQPWAELRPHRGKQKRRKGSVPSALPHAPPGRARA